MQANPLRKTDSSFLGILAGILWLLVGCGNEPRYHGKSLSDWLTAYRDAQEASPAEREAESAIRAIGTNGLSCLTTWVISSDPSLAGQGRQGLRILGTEAAQAIPVLAPLVTSTNDLVALSASLALATIGARAVPTLLNALSNSDYRVSLNVMLALPELGTNARPAIPFLLQELGHPEPHHRERAAASLGSLSIEPEVVVPALSDLLYDTLRAVRFHAINGLAGFGPRARTAVPQIVAIMNDPLANDGLRTTAKEAIIKIAPETLTNAPSR